MNNCPNCSSLQVSGFFKTRPGEKQPKKKYRVQSKHGGTTIIHGDYDTVELARAGACGSATASILIRKD